MPPALGERKRPQISAVEPNQIEGHVGGAPRGSEQVIELRSACFVDGDDLTVENRVAHIECGCNLVAEAAKRLIRLLLREIMRQRPCSK